MTILFITIAFPEKPEDRNIYTDLMHEIRNRGNDVYVVTSRERRYRKKTQISVENGLNVLRVRTWNIQKTNIFEKGIATLLVERQFIGDIKKFLNNIKFDIIVYSTPPVTFERVIKYVKQRDNARTYLILKDIFPQNAVDIGMLRKNSFIHRYFRSKEINLYKISDYIGCMSQANVNYIIRHNTYLNHNILEVCSNSISPTVILRLEAESSIIRKKYGIPNDAVVFVYGGNLGKPQGIDFLIEIIESNKTRCELFFLIVGSGTEYEKIRQYFDTAKCKNAILFQYLPKHDYDILLQACDIGMIFLDPRFSIPNFPSRMLTYMENSMPVVAATDETTDVGIVITEGKFGLWSRSGDLESFNQNISLLCQDKLLIEKMGINAREYLENNFTVSKSYDIIMNHFTAGAKINVQK